MNNFRYLTLVFLFFLLFVNGIRTSAEFKESVNTQIASSSSIIYLPYISKPSFLIFDIADNVPEQDVEEIRTGMEFAQSDLNMYFGGDIPADVQSTIAVKIVATGLGNQEPGGGGSCCTGLTQSGARPFFDVLHSNWTIAPPYPYTLKTHHQTVAAHEYAHGWQWSLGCLSISSQPFGDWMNEGIAHYVGHAPFIRNNIMTVEDVRDFQLSSAIFTGEVDVPLEELEMSNGIWPGHVGYLAIEYLVSQAANGELSIRTICESIGNGKTVESAFEDTFGMTKAYFYETAWPQYFNGLKGE